jgi:hypothetical protein
MTDSPVVPVDAWSRLRRGFTAIGILGLVLVGASCVMFSVALSQGIHCPHCDRQQLGDRYSWWAAYFNMKDLLWIVGGAGGLASLVAAKRRRWGAIALGLGAMLLLMTPT